MWLKLRRTLSLFNILDQPFNSEFSLELLAGNVNGKRYIRKFGRNPDIDTVDGFEAIWNGGGPYTGFDAIAAETVEVFSSDANDTSAGTGARTVELSEGLDANFDLIAPETVILNGVTAVNTVNSYIRLPRVRVMTAGSGGVNAGTITARQNVTTANIFIVMPIGYNTSMLGAYTIPNGENACLVSSYSAYSGNVNANSNIRINTREDGGVFIVRSELSLKSAGTSYLPKVYPFTSIVLPGKTDVFMSADTDTNNTAIACEFNLVLEDL